MTTKGKRIIYSEADCHRLVDIVLSYRDIVECKKTDSTTWKEKIAAWEKISRIYNASTTEPRTSEQLRGKFDNLKKEVRKYEALQRQNLYRTGGGVDKPEIKDALKFLYEKIKSIISFSVKGLEPTMGDGDFINTIDMKSNTETYDQLETEVNVCDEMLASTSQPFEVEIYEMVPKSNENLEQLVMEVPELDATLETDETKTKDWANYTPRMLKSRKHKALQIKRKKIDSETNDTSQDENEDFKKKMFYLKKELLEKEAAREENFHEMRMKMEEELYRHKIRNQILQNEKLELEISILKKQL